MQKILEGISFENTQQYTGMICEKPILYMSDLEDEIAKGKGVLFSQVFNVKLLDVIYGTLAVTGYKMLTFITKPDRVFLVDTDKIIDTIKISDALPNKKELDILGVVKTVIPNFYKFIPRYTVINKTQLLNSLEIYPSNKTPKANLKDLPLDFERYFCV